MNSFRADIFEKIGIILPDLKDKVYWGIHLPRDGVWEDYVVLTPVTAPVESENTGSETIEARTVRFQIFCNSLETIGVYTDTLYQGFRKYSNVLSDGNRIISCSKEAEDCFLDPNRWSDGSEVWISALQLVFMVQRRISDK